MCSMWENSIRYKIDLHHKNHNKTDDSYKNIEILCETHHQEKEGRDKKIRDLK